ncbi:MAG: hypothetical protein RIR89_259 [Actinomycetota bacterium]|jgi:hypothetical protein
MIEKFKKSKFSGMKKLGDTKTATYPDGFSDGALSWSNVSRDIIGAQADAWFESYGPVPITKSLPKNALAYSQPFLENYLPFLIGENEVNVFPSFKTSFEDLGNQQKIDESPLGKKLIETLAATGISWFWETTQPINPFEYIQIPDAHLEGIAQWGTYFGMPIQQKFRVYKDKNGKEHVVWFSAVIAATRPFEHISERHVFDGNENAELDSIAIPQSDLDKGALTFGQWSTNLLIPALLKRLFYLSETPFPSNIMTFPRTMAYKDVPEEKLPKPIYIHAKDERVSSAFETSSTNNQVSAAQMPDVIYMGWTFDADDFETQKTILTTITDGLVRINSYVEDGYLNFKQIDFGYPWEYVVGDATIFDFRVDLEKSSLGLSQWVPAVRLGLLLNESNVRMQKAFDLDKAQKFSEARAEFEWIVRDGAGMFIPNCTNSLVFGWLINEQKWEEIDRYLESSVRMDFGNESTNSMSNWGIAKYKQGLVDEAMQRFELALEQPDKYAESEASYWLAKIWVEKGDAAKAKTYQDRCDAAGGYDGAPDTPKGGEPTTLTKASSGLGLGGGSKIGAGSAAATEASPAGVAKFCSNCGSGFASPSAKFCQECGNPR